MKTRLRDPASWFPQINGLELTQPSIILLEEYCKSMSKSHQVDCAHAEDDGDEGEGVEDGVQRVLLGARRRHEQPGFAGKHHYGLK